MLVGRKLDLDAITDAVLDRQLVLLHGYSGVGKSSMLQNGLYNRLSVAGFTVLVSRIWPPVLPGFSGSPDEAERYVIAGIRLTHVDPPIPVPDFIEFDTLMREGGLCRILDQRYEDADESAVIILDQFEELLRHHHNVAEAVVRWVIRVGYAHNVRVVLSLRTDSLHLLDPLLRGVKPYSMDRISVHELSDVETVKQVICTMDPSVECDVADDAVRLLIDMWQLQRPDGANNISGPSLLDLQASLYSLYFRAKGRGRSDAVAIELQDVLKLQSDAGVTISPFRYGLTDAIRLKIEHAEEACRLQGLDEYLIDGTREVVRRTAPVLSSGDFKVPIRDVEMAHRVLARELRVLEGAVAREVEPSRAAARATVLQVVAGFIAGLIHAEDFLAVSAAEIGSESSPPELEAVLRTPADPQDPARPLADVTAGPLMGSTATATLLEECRRVVFAIEWLTATKVIRKDPDGTLLLVHDGSGPALTAWAEAPGLMPAYALRQLTASSGDNYEWTREGDQGSIEWTFDGKEGYKAIVNVNWRDCRVSANLRKIVFVNCDFRGSRFVGCRLQGVTFVNCLLDDANFQNCTIIGSVDIPRIETKRTEGAEDRQKARLAPSFSVATSTDTVRAFLPYLDIDEPAVSEFFSDTSGKAARPGAPPRDHPGRIMAVFTTTATSDPEGDLSTMRRMQTVPDVTPASGGVAMVGGRLCFLTLYGCTSRMGGSFAFHHVSGDGLDIVEQHGGTVDIHDGAVRGISVSLDDDSFAPVGDAVLDPMELTVTDSLVSNIYFTGGLVGAARFDNSVVWMLINASENSTDGFRVRLKNCRYQFLVNTDAPDDSHEDSDLPEAIRYFERIENTHSRFSASNRLPLARDLEAMDYRFHPELWEERQRKRRAVGP